MGRKGTGVEVRGKAIRIQFSLNGEVVRRTLRRDGMAIPPSAENLGEATRLAAEIRSRIADGTFCHSEYFPATRNDGRPLTVGEHLDVWLAVQRIEPSTAAAYASADFFVFPSESDTFGNVVLEAQASGLTVLAAGAGGPLDLVLHGDNGFLFTPGDVDDLARRLEWLIANPVFSYIVRRRARHSAERRSWDSVMAGLFAQYEGLVGTRRGVELRALAS